jgi:hypothetical protein
LRFFEPALEFSGELCPWRVAHSIKRKEGAALHLAALATALVDRVYGYNLNV